MASSFSEMTDFEIDVAVAGIIHPGRKITNFAGEAVVWFGNLETRIVRYCNSWADAGPIIERELIALSPERTDAGHYRWFAFSNEKEGYQQVASNSPLRAAMIVFLMMNEAANA